MKSLLSLLAVFLVVTSVGCKQNQQSAKTVDSRQPIIEKTIVWYTAFLADCYRSLNTQTLDRVATRKMVDTTYFHMAAIGEAGVKMDSKLKKITFSPLKEIGPDTVEVPAEEDWDYTYWDIMTGKRLFDNTVHYRLTYQLEHKTDKWLVSDVIVNKTEESKDSSFIFERPSGSKPGEKINATEAKD